MMMAGIHRMLIDPDATGRHRDLLG